MNTSRYIKRVRTASHRSMAVPSNAPVHPFANDEQMIQAALVLIRARSQLKTQETQGFKKDEELDQLRRRTRALEIAWHQAFSRASRKARICSEAKRRRFTRIERELLAALLLNSLRLLPEQVGVCSELLRVIDVPESRMLEGMRAISETGRLFKSGILSYQDPDSELAHRSPVIDQTYVDCVLNRGKESTWRIHREPQLYDKLASLTELLAGQVGPSWGFRFRDLAEQRQNSYRISLFLQRLNHVLSKNPSWKLNRIKNTIQRTDEWTILLALIGKELGHRPADDSLFTGSGLAQAVCQKTEDHRRIYQRLGSNGTLVKRKLVRPCGGKGEFASDDFPDLRETEFELGDEALSLLELEHRTWGRQKGRFTARSPVVSLNQLVLPSKVIQAVEMAMVQVRHAKQLFDKWGLGQTIAYGRGAVLLFSGPPGTGKTATAEAIAKELKKSILVADYSRIQNCYVGETEKNIVRVFREAARQEAILFWDEADAMFYDRDAANRTWEIRDVNVLLQELERFEGVCILATNRKVTLDKALERRITVKVDFERPGVEERRRIWQAMLPKRLPLARDVDIGQLAEADLSGGQIKNVVLNSARLALQQKQTGAVRMQTFQQAIDMELKGGWNNPTRRIGFC